MVVSGFCPYHRLVQDDAPTKRAGVILTPWAMPLVLGATTTTMHLSDFKVSTSMYGLPCSYMN
jgi:hypothetical protein